MMSVFMPVSLLNIKKILQLICEDKDYFILWTIVTHDFLIVEV